MANNKAIEKDKKDIAGEINIDEIKKEVVEYAYNSVDKKIDELVRKTDKKIINIKNRSIFKRNIIIIILLCLSLFLTYLLYNEGYFDKFFSHNNNTVTEDVTQQSVPVESEDDDETKLDKLKKKYSYLLDNIIISEESPYLVDLYNGKLTNKMKLSIAITNVEKEKIEQDEDVYTIKEEDLKKEYAKLFNIDKYKATSFELNYIDIKYLKSGNMYLFYEPLDFNTNIRREIMGINEKDNAVKITVFEGYIIDNILYNITTKEVINEKNISIVDNCKKLNKITYVFEKINDNYILSGVEV